MPENLSPDDFKAKIMAELASLAEAGMFATVKELDSLDAKWASVSPSQTENDAYQAIAAPLREMLMQESAREAELAAKVQESIDTLCTLLESKDMDGLKDARQTEDEKIRALGKLPAKLQRKYNDMHNKVSAALACHFETLDLARWESYTLKLDICKELTALQDIPEKSLPQAATTLQKLRSRWKTLGSVPKEKNDEINASFLELTRALQHRIDSFFAARHQQQKEVLKIKNEICAEAEPLATSTDWKNTATKFKSMQQQWQELPGCGKQETELFQKFRSYANAFFNARSEAYRNASEKYAANTARKEELIAAITALELHDFIRAKELRAEFNAAPHAGHSENDLRERFNAGMNDFFARRKEFFAQKDAECAELITTLGSADRKTADTIIAQLKNSQNRHNSELIARAINSCEKRLAAERESAVRAKNLEAATIKEKLLAACLDMNEKNISDIPDETTLAAFPKLAAVAKLITDAANGNEKAAAELNTLIKVNHSKAEKLLDRLESAAGLKKSGSDDLAAELQAAIIGNSGWGSQHTTAKDCTSEIKEFQELFPVTDATLTARFETAKEALNYRKKS